MTAPRDALAQLAALYRLAYRAGHHDTVEGSYTDVFQSDRFTYFVEQVEEELKDSDFETLRALLGAADGVRLTESDVVALVAGPYMYHHKMNDLQTRYAEGFDRCREMTIDSIKTRFAIEATLTKAPAND